MIGINTSGDNFDSNFNLATEEYAEIVRDIAERDLPMEIPNRHIDHAAVLENEILRLTARRVLIVTGTFPELIYEKIKNQFVAALRREVLVEIILADATAPVAELHELIRKFPNLQVHRWCPAQRRDINHFMVSDGKRMRLEDIHPQQDFKTNPSIKAKASFNDEESAASLDEAFKNLRGESQPFATA